MRMDLAKFYQTTDGGRKVHRDQKPSLSDHITRSLLGHGRRVIAQGILEENRTFHVSQERMGQDMWLEIRRSDGTLEEEQTYHPRARAYSHNVTQYDNDGSKIISYLAFSHDGRVVEEINRDEHQQLSRIAHHYPDLHGPASDERHKYGKVIQCHTSLERRYRDKAGTNIEVDEHIGPDQFCMREEHYDDDGKRVYAVVEYQPKSRSYKKVTTFAENGLKDSEQLYNEQGQTTYYTEYHASQATDESGLKKKLEKFYSNSFLQREARYREDGTISNDTEYEPDGKTIKRYQKYSSTGEFPIESQEFENGVITRKTLMELVDGEPQAKRIILYDGGKPYRSRERHHWEGSEDFWGETEIERENGYPLFTVIPTPTGLIRHEYDKNTGKVKKTSRYREEELGETLEQVTHYYPTKPWSTHPEQEASLITRRIERFADDGETLDSSRDFRTDKSIKSVEEREPDGHLVRRVYPPGTRRVEEDTPVIFESVRNENGELKHTSLYGHSDPSIIALHKEYESGNTPTSVRIHTLDGEEELSWAEYTRRKTAERNARTQPGSVLLATISPDIRELPEGETHLGRTIITLQGDAAALNKARSQLMHKFPEANCAMYTGDRQWLQYRNLPGRYVEDDPSLHNHPLIEKVNVMTVIVPYQHVEDDSWPQRFPSPANDNDMADMLRQRGVEEAAEALKKIFRYTSCDLQLKLSAQLTKSNDETGKTEYHPYVRLSWPNPPYLPAAQNAVISTMLSDQIMKREFACTHIPGENTIDIFAPATSQVKNIASRMAQDTMKQIANGFIPASLRHDEAEKQL